jgi:hypothetical protein
MVLSKAVLEKKLITIQLCTGARLASCGISSVLKLFDAANAFPSIPHHRIRDLHKGAASDLDEQLLNIGVTTCISILQTSDGFVLLKSGSGVPQGHTIATDVFNATYNHTILDFTEATNSITPMLIGIPPDITNGKISMKINFQRISPTSNNEDGTFSSDAQLLQAASTIFNYTSVEKNPTSFLRLSTRPFPILSIVPSPLLLTTLLLVLLPLIAASLVP